MLFALDEGVLDFFDVSQASGLLDGIEGLIDDFHVSLVVVNELDFFLVVEDKFGQSVLKD